MIIRIEIDTDGKEMLYKELDLVRDVLGINERKYKEAEQRNVISTQANLIQDLTEQLRVADGIIAEEKLADMEEHPQNLTVYAEQPPAAQPYEDKK